MIELQNIIDFAIKRGTTSLSYFTDSATVFSKNNLSRFFEELYAEELSLQKKLVAVRDVIHSRYGQLTIPLGKVRSYLVDAKPAYQTNSLQALLWASIRTETSERLYVQLGKYVEVDELKRFFISMADEENVRRRRIEAFYDDSVMLTTDT